MAQTYRTTKTLYLSLCGAETEVDAEISYSFTPGHPAKLYGPPEDCYPAEGPEVEVDEVTVIIDGKRHALPDWQVRLIERDMLDELAEDATDSDADAREYAAEMWRDMQRAA